MAIIFYDVGCTTSFFSIRNHNAADKSSDPSFCWYCRARQGFVMELMTRGVMLFWGWNGSLGTEIKQPTRELENWKLSKTVGHNKAFGDI